MAHNMADFENRSDDWLAEELRREQRPVFDMRAAERLGAEHARNCDANAVKVRTDSTIRVREEGRVSSRPYSGQPGTGPAPVQQNRRPAAGKNDKNAATVIIILVVVYMIIAFIFSAM